jgi:DNA-binding PadR family transcriptional regulator
MLLLAILRLKDEAYAPDIAATLEDRAGRRISRGALYSTLDRMEQKGYLTWNVHPSTQERAGHRRRRFAMTARGMKAVRASYVAIQELAHGLGRELNKEPTSR